MRCKKKKLCAGSMRHLVNVMERTQVAPKFGNVEPVENFVITSKIYMKIKTVTGGSWVNGIQTMREATHVFSCRYIPVLDDIDITASVLEYSGKYYRIIKIDHVDEDNLVMDLQCAVRGDIAKGASEA